MIKNTIGNTVIAVTFLVASAAACAESIGGTPESGAGDKWQSSWVNLEPTLKFSKGETLLIRVAGDAKNVLIRLLPEGSSPGSSEGIEGGIRDVPTDKLLVVQLERDHPRIKQISVHAGKEAWGRSLGETNGTVTIVSIDRRTP